MSTNIFPGYPQAGYAPNPADYLAQMMAMAYQQRQPIGTPQKVPQAMHPATQIPSMIWVNGYQEADSYPVSPGEVIPLWDRNQPYVYRREADQAGKPSTRTFAISEVPEPPQSENDAVTRREFNVLTKAVGDLVAALNGMTYTPKYEVKESVNDG